MSLREAQTRFASHLRNPEGVPGPEGIEERRLKIYRELFYNNIENFVSNSFPVLRTLFEDRQWHRLVRDFMIHHRCQSPYFLEISQEFLLYLQEVRKSAAADPPFMLELAHYEWVELGLDVAEEDLDSIVCDRGGDLLDELPVVSPLAWSLVYHYPVHRIGREYQPQNPPAEPTCLIVYRDRSDEVHFMETNAVTARLLELLQSDQTGSGGQALLCLADEIQHPQPDQLTDFGLELMRDLLQRDIILGTVVPT